jgi:hypothetical protein
LKPEEKYFVYHEDPEIQRLSVDVFTFRYEISKLWKRKDTHIEKPGDNLGVEVPKSLLAYKCSIVTKAFQEVQKQIEKSESEKDDNKITELLKKSMSLKKIEMEIMKALGERVVNPKLQKA